MQPQKTSSPGKVLLTGESISNPGYTEYYRLTDVLTLQTEVASLRLMYLISFWSISNTEHKTAWHVLY